MDGIIFVGTNFHGLNKNFMGLKICGHGIFFHNSYRKLQFPGYWNLWIRPSTKTTKICTPRNLSHPQYCQSLAMKTKHQSYLQDTWQWDPRQTSQAAVVHYWRSAARSAMEVSLRYPAPLAYTTPRTLAWQDLHC